MAVKQKLLKASEVADMLGGKWTRQRVHKYLTRGVFPEPYTYAGTSPLWTPQQVESFKKSKYKWGGQDER